MEHLEHNKEKRSKEIMGASARSCQRREGTLVDQPERTELEYRIIAVNKVGEGLGQ